MNELDLEPIKKRCDAATSGPWGVRLSDPWYSFWGFLFAPYKEQGLTTKKAWEEFLKNRTIFDEYDREVPLHMLLELIEIKQGDKTCSDYRLDDDRYIFTSSADFC